MKNIILTKELEEFLVKATMSRSPYWNQQIIFLFLTQIFIVAQFFVSKIIPFICLIGLILSLAKCKKNEDKMYGNVYNGFIQMTAWSIIWWIDGWCACSLILDTSSFIIACLTGHLIYIGLLLWRAFIVKKKISSNWYQKIPNKAANVVGVMAFVFSFGTFLRLLVSKINLELEIAIAVLAGLCFLMCLLLIFIVDIGLACYYFSILTEEDQKKVMRKELIPCNCK